MNFGIRKRKQKSPDSPFAANKKAKLGESDDASSSDSDLNDAEDSEVEPEASSPAVSRSTESQLTVLLQALELGHLSYDDHDSSFLDTLLSISVAQSSTRSALAAFREICRSVVDAGVGVSIQPTDAFLNLTGKDVTWACHDDDLTGLWNEVVGSLVSLGCNPEHLVKPSGAMAVR